VAAEAFNELGRGAIVVDTTSRLTGEGNPFDCYSQEIVEKKGNVDIKRMVREYDPGKGIVVVLLKPNERIRTYQVKPLPQL